MVSFTEELDAPGIMTIYDENRIVIERDTIDSSKSNIREKRRKLAPVSSKHLKKRYFKRGNHGVKPTVKYSRADSVPKMGILPPDYHIIEDFDEDVIIKLNAIKFNEGRNIDSIVDQAFKKAKIKMRIKKDSLYFWPSKSTGIYEIIKNGFGPGLIDSLKILTDKDVWHRKKRDRFMVREIEIDSGGNNLILKFKDDKFTKVLDFDRMEALENQMESLGEKLDSIIKIQKESDLNQYFTRLEELIQRFIENSN